MVHELKEQTWGGTILLRYFLIFHCHTCLFVNVSQQAQFVQNVCSNLRTKHFRTISSQLLTIDILTFNFYNAYFIFVATTRLIIDVSNCDEPQKTVIDDARNKQNITSHCYCEIKSNFTGELVLASKNICRPGFNVFDDNGQFNNTFCYNNHRAYFRRNVTKGDKLKIVLINNSSFQSGNHGKIVQIYASMFKNYFF